MAAVNLGRDEVTAEFILAPINLREIGCVRRCRGQAVDILVNTNITATVITDRAGYQRLHRPLPVTDRLTACRHGRWGKDPRDRFGGCLFRS
jgi:hypothetical protein